MNKLVIKLMVIIVLSCAIQHKMFGQKTPNTDWETMQPKESLEALETYTSFLDEIFDWEANTQESYLTIGLEASKALKNDTTAYKYAYQLANLYLSEGDYFKAIEVLNQSVELANTNSLKMSLYNLTGYAFSELEDYETALDYYFRAIALEKGKKTPVRFAYIFISITSSYIDLEDYDNAIKYARSSNNIGQQLPFPEQEYVSIFNYCAFAEVYAQKEQLDSTKFYIDLALTTLSKVDTIKSFKYNELVKMTYVQAIDRYLELGLNEIAAEYLQKIKSFQLTYNKEYAILLATEYDIQQGNYQNALKRLEQFDFNTLHFRDKETVLNLKIGAYEGLGNSAEVISLYQSLVELQQEKVKSDRTRDGLLADIKYETFKKNEEIKSLRLDQEVKSLAIQNQRFVIALAVILTATLLGLFIFMRKRAQDRQNLSEYLQKEVDIKTQDLQKANTNLQKANEELRIMNYIASHDIKEPMRNIGNYLGLIKRKLPNETKPKVNEYFEIIQKSIKQLYTLVEDVATYINMSKEETVNIEATDMKHLVSSLFFSVDTYRQERNGVLQSDNLPILSTSSTMIYVILKNLVENGLKYNQSETPTVKITYQATEKFHQIMVSDNGIGIEKAYHEKIFESFKRLHNRGEYKGSGIGLSIVKLLVEKLNGQVTIDSEVGKGSRFIIQLPK